MTKYLLGRSQAVALADTVHVVKKHRYVGGGIVAKWLCERGRGETYGAETWLASSPGPVTCEACRKVVETYDA